MQPEKITIAEMCAAAADVFAVSAKFLLIEPYLPAVTA